jgi:hypothetical protein
MQSAPSFFLNLFVCTQLLRSARGCDRSPRPVDLHRDVLWRLEQAFRKWPPCWFVPNFREPTEGDFPGLGLFALWCRLAMEKDKAPNPIDVNLLCSQRIMLEADGVANPVQ